MNLSRWSGAQSVAMVGLFAASSLANAVLSIQPQQPALHEAVHLVDPTLALLPDGYYPGGTTLSMTGNVITVTLHSSGFEPVSTLGPPLDVALGKFPAGSYDVTLLYDNSSGSGGPSTIGSAHFTVAPADTAAAFSTPLFDYTDLWWTPAESGWGLSFVQHISGHAFAAWFVYGFDGKPAWYVMPGGTWMTSQSGSQFSGSVYKTSGPYFGGAFNPGNVLVLPSGTATFQFTDFSHAHLSYTIDGVTVAKVIERELFANSSPGSAQLAIEPAQPILREPVHLKTNILFYIPGVTTLSMAGNVITVTLQQPAGLFAGFAPLEVVLGEFPQGSYDVNLMAPSAGPPVQVGTAHFTVGAGDFIKPAYNYSDLWWTPAESGWGLTIAHQPNKTFFAAWFVYGSDGKPTWYVIPGGTWSYGGPDLLEGPVYKTTGPYFGGAFNPANVAVTQAGTASLKFTDFGHASFTYTVDGVTATKAIERQPF